MRSAFALVAVVICLATGGCGGGGGSESETRKLSSADQTQRTSMCGSTGFSIELHGVTCEVVNAMVVLLDGRARHQTLTLSTGSQKVSWVCVSRSIVGPMECRNGARYFVVEKD